MKNSFKEYINNLIYLIKKHKKDIIFFFIVWLVSLFFIIGNYKNANASNAFTTGTLKYTIGDSERTIEIYDNSMIYYGVNSSGYDFYVVMTYTTDLGYPYNVMSRNVEVYYCASRFTKFNNIDDFDNVHYYGDGLSVDIAYDLFINTVSKPTPAPTSTPTPVPTVEPSTVPTVEPSTVPTVEPSVSPTVVPTNDPQDEPTSSPGGNDPNGSLPPGEDGVSYDIGDKHNILSLNNNLPENFLLTKIYNLLFLYFIWDMAKFILEFIPIRIRRLIKERSK